MSDDFELKLVRIQWHSKNQFAYISEIAQNPIEVSEQKDKHFTAEIPSYPHLVDNISCQFSVQLKTVAEPPVVKVGEGTIELFPIIDSKHGKWWIEKGSWVKRGENQYHDAPSCRHAGELTILIGDITIHLNIIPSGFTPTEFQNLLSAFKGELWQLILEKKSTTTVSKDSKGKLPGEEFQKHVSEFIKYTDQILAKPTEELKERQEIQRIERVRPTAKTFMELAAKGSSIKFITGRGFEPSYDTPENKYIADIISRLILIVRNLRDGVGYSKESLYRTIENLGFQISQSNNDFFTIDPEKLDAEIRQEEQKKKNWEQKKIGFLNYFTNADIYNQNLGPERDITFTVKNVKIEDEYPDYIDVWIKQKGEKGALIKIPSGSCNPSFFSKNVTYKIIKVAYSKSDYGTFIKAEVHKLSRIEILCDPSMDLLKNERIKYSRNNWQRPLTQQEIKEKEIELQGVKKRKDMLLHIFQQYEEKLAKLNSIYKALLTLSSRCKSLKITVENRLEYPGTMTFVQNPSYRGAYSSFKEIQKEAKFEDLFDDLLTIQEFGITDQPNIYEKWCLLQIINVLGDYGFTQNQGWEIELVKLISEKKYTTCSFKFKHHSLSQQVELIYQPKLSNGKIPDFMLKIISSTDETVLVLDAKNKNYERSSALYNTFSEDLNNLLNKKDYSESGNNAVFILHPMKEKGFLPTLPTPQSWSSCSALGGSSIFDWDEAIPSPKHMYGGVQVRPENLDNLKMVIALSLQYLTEDNHSVYNKIPPRNTRFCIICGGTELETNTRSKTKGKHYTCKKCQHFFVEHYCNCGNRIWKHGSYWTYHDIRSTSPYNIKCPKCNGFYVA